MMGDSSSFLWLFVEIRNYQATIKCIILPDLVENLFSSVQFNKALIAQLVERVTSNDEVAGSTPS
jgi:hypothetical protein